MLVIHGGKDVVAHPGTSHSGRSLTSIYCLAIRVSTEPYHDLVIKLEHIIFVKIVEIK